MDNLGAKHREAAVYTSTLRYGGGWYWTKGKRGWRARGKSSVKLNLRVAYGLTHGQAQRLLDSTVVEASANDGAELLEEIAWHKWTGGGYRESVFGNVNFMKSNGTFMKRMSVAAYNRTLAKRFPSKKPAPVSGIWLLH